MSTIFVECVICEGEFNELDCVVDDGYWKCTDCAECDDWKRCDDCDSWLSLDEQYNSPDCDDGRVWCGLCLPEVVDYSAGSDDYFKDLVWNEASFCTSWGDWAAAAEFADEIDFGCRWDSDGKCQGSDRWGSGAACCCKNCAGCRGYLEAIPPEALETVKRDYDGETGFWRPGGCILPRKWRSWTCQRYRCSDNGPDDEIGRMKDYAWAAFYELFRYSPEDRKLTINQLRLLMRELGLLKDVQLVTIS